MFDAALLESGKGHHFGDRKKSLPVAIALHAAMIAAFVGARCGTPASLPDPVIPVMFPPRRRRHLLSGTAGIDRPKRAQESSASGRRAGARIREVPSSAMDDAPTPGDPRSMAPNRRAAGRSRRGDRRNGRPPDAGGLAGPAIRRSPDPLGGDVVARLLVARIEPDYPESMRRARVEGVVILEAVITASGDVDDVRVLKSAGPVLDRAASDAVRRWRYRPATLNGRAVSVYLTVTVKFGLSP